MKQFLLKKTLLLVACLALMSSGEPKKEIFLIGDSISVQYWPYLKEYLSGWAELERKTDDGQAEKNLDVPAGANGGDSRMVVEFLRSKFKDPAFRPNYLLLNCGLHDIKHDPQTGVIQVTEADYRKNLNEIIRLLQKNKVSLVWIRTTWVVDEIHNSKSASIRRYEADVLKYNAIADEVCRKHKIPSIDLYSFSKQLGIEHIIDHVHYDDATRSLQAAYIAGFVQNILY
ncbi:MAG: SGNH/GDSL hydrolase family protein [Dysgonamonadaceae bacterium]|jgi:lysophospholipase L1-like esterase|nr:SGNH/GDSL hydrolase family protein [Dysgonamonadaceae bacterium]